MAGRAPAAGAAWEVSAPERAGGAGMVWRRAGRRWPGLLEYRDIYAGGRLRPSASPDAITVANPATEEIMGAAPAASDKDVEVAVGAARQACDCGPWPRADRADRADAMDRLAAALQARAQDTAHLVTAEMGMPITASRLHNAETPVTTSS